MPFSPQLLGNLDHSFDKPLSLIKHLEMRWSLITPPSPPLLPKSEKHLLIQGFACQQCCPFEIALFFGSKSFNHVESPQRCPVPSASRAWKISSTSAACSLCPQRIPSWATGDAVAAVSPALLAPAPQTNSSEKVRETRKQISDESMKLGLDGSGQARSCAGLIPHNATTHSTSPRPHGWPRMPALLTPPP